MPHIILPIYDEDGVTQIGEYHVPHDGDNGLTTEAEPATGGYMKLYLTKIAELLKDAKHDKH